MAAPANSNKVSLQQGDIVHAPFAGLDGKGEVFSKHRYAYVAEMIGEDAHLVYLSSSPKNIDGYRYGGDLKKHENIIAKDMFYNAGQTTTVHSDFLKKSSTLSLSAETKDAIHSSIVKEKKELAEARTVLRNMRADVASAVDPQYIASKTSAADAIAAKNEKMHEHTRIRANGEVQHLSIEGGWKPAGKVLPNTLEEMKKDAPHRFPLLESHAHPKPGPEPASAIKSAVPDGFTKVVNDNGKEVLLMGAKKEALKETVQAELAKAGHVGTELSAENARKLAVSLASAQKGELLAITAEGAHQILAKGAAHPIGATVLDAVAMRMSAKIAESALMRGLTGPAGTGVEGVMAAAAFFDTASGHYLTKSPLGEAVAYVGDKSGAFHAAMKTQEVVEPVLNKAGQLVSEFAEKTGATAFLGEQLAKQQDFVLKVHKSTGLDTAIAKAVELAETSKSKLESVIRDNVHGPDNPSIKPGERHHADKISAVDPAAHLQSSIVKEMQAAGHKDFRLSASECQALAKELCQVKPGDHLVVEQKGDIYLTVAQAGTKHPDVPRDSIVFDADALRENAGIARAAEFGKNAQDAKSREELADAAQHSQMARAA